MPTAKKRSNTTPNKKTVKALPTIGIGASAGGLGIENGRLRLTQFQKGFSHRAPINHFFRSLAEQQADRAVGIILSGMGSDGSIGIQAIKGQLGMVMVQDPDSARYDGMPQSAIQTGLVDYVL